MELPDEPLVINDNERALAFITKEGLLGRFGEHRGPARCSFTMVKYVDHNTHWIIACRHVGHDNDFDVIVKKPSKIGYLVCTIPKSKYSIQHVDRFMNYLNESWKKRNDPKPDQNKRFSF